MRLPRIPRPPLPPLPRPVAQARTAALTAARRRSVKLLSAASGVPVVRPVADLGLRVLFDRLADSWEQIRQDPQYREGFREALRQLPRGFRPRRVLDVACGTGIAAAEVLARWPGVKVVGIDVSPGMVRHARQLVPDASFEVASVHQLPYEDGAFDLVVALDGVLDLTELMRVTHRKGRLLIVYSAGGTTPVSRPLDELTQELAALGAHAHPHTDGQAHVVVARHAR